MLHCTVPSSNFHSTPLSSSSTAAEAYREKMVTTRRSSKRRIEEEQEATLTSAENNTLQLKLPWFLPSNFPHQHISHPRVPKRIKMCEKLAELVLKVADSQNPAHIPSKLVPSTLKSPSKATSSCLSTDLEPQADKASLQVLPVVESCSPTISGRYPNRRVRQVPCRRNKSTAAIGAIKKENHDEKVPDETQMETPVSESLHNTENQASTTQLREGSEVILPIIEEIPKSLNEVDCDARPAISLNLSAVAELDGDGTSSLDSELLDAAVYVGSYRVKANLAPTLRDILSKCGDIGEKCDKKSIMLRSWLVENVCNIVLKLQTEEFVHLTPVEVDGFRVLVKDIESVGMEVGWLCQRLNEIYEAKRLLKQSPQVKQAKCQSKQATKDREEEINIYKEEITVYEEDICRLQEKITSARKEVEVKRAEEKKFDEILSYTKEQVKKFYCGSMIDGLL